MGAAKKLSDQQWQVIEPLLPLPNRMGRPRADDRQTLDAILFVLRSGCRWEDLPKELGSPTTAWRRLKSWEEAGVWENIWCVGEYLACSFSFARSPRQTGVGTILSGRFFCSGQKRGAGVGKTKKGKGTKWMLVTDGNGIPIGFHLDSASPAEVKLADQTLKTVRVKSRAGQLKTRPCSLTADRAYDSRAFRKSLRKRGIKVCIPPRRRPQSWRKKRGRPVTADHEIYKQRFKVERSFSWMGNFRRLLMRWESHLSVYSGFCFLALALICLDRLLK
jgi:transposase